MKIKKGTLLVLERGCYSDFQYHGPFTVLKEFDQEEVGEAFRGSFEPDEYGDVYIVTGEFVPWLHKNGYIEDCPTHTWFLGDYDFEPEIQKDIGTAVIKGK